MSICKNKIMMAIVICMLCLGVSPVSAFANDKNDESMVVEIDDYQFYSVEKNSLPAEIKPLQFATFEDAVKYLKGTDGIEVAINENDANEQTQMLRAAVQKEETKVLFSDLNGKLNVTARYLSDGNKITSCQKVYSYLSGLNVMRTWEETDATYLISPNKQKLDVTISGVLTTFIIVDSDTNPFRVSEAKVYDVTFEP